MTPLKTHGSSMQPRLNGRLLHPIRTVRSSWKSREYAEDHEKTYGRFPKTLIFAANDLPHTSHADQLVAMAREIFGRRAVRP